MIWLNYRLKMLSPLHCQSWLTDTEWQYAQTLSEKRARQFCNGRALVRKMLQHIDTQETTSDMNLVFSLVDGDDNKFVDPIS